MKKLIFKKFYKQIFLNFLSTLLVMGLIIWTIQAVNYFDFVSQDGHGLKIYFSYSILNFPKIINRILPFIFFISLFYTLINCESKNELNIFWINGISKMEFLNKLIILTILIFFVQLFLGTLVSPESQFKARNYLKNSKVDLFGSLIKEGKFIDIAKDLTIFIYKKDGENIYKDIFLDDSTKDDTKMIYAKSGNLVINDYEKLFKLVDGRVINNRENKINVFNFENIDFNFGNLESNTITTPKIQEIGTITLLGCFINIKTRIYEAFNCDKKILDEVKLELFKRIFSPIYLLIICTLSCFLIIYSNNNIRYNLNKKLVFLIGFLIIIISEVLLRYTINSNFYTYVYLSTPIILFIIFYFVFYKLARNV